MKKAAVVYYLHTYCFNFDLVFKEGDISYFSTINERRKSKMFTITLFLRVIISKFFFKKSIFTILPTKSARIYLWYPGLSRKSYYCIFFNTLHFYNLQIIHTWHFYIDHYTVFRLITSDVILYSITIHVNTRTVELRLTRVRNIDEPRSHSRDNINIERSTE